MIVSVVFTNKHKTTSPKRLQSDHHSDSTLEHKHRDGGYKPDCSSLFLLPVDDQSLDAGLGLACTQLDITLGPVMHYITVLPKI